MRSEIKQRIYNSVKEILPTTTKTCLWILKLTVGVSFLILLLKYFNLLPLISSVLNPAFKHLGLPGDAALAYVTGYFVNVYSAIAVINTLDLNMRAITIISTMVLCSHSMIIETAVLKKTGASGIRMVIVRTISAFILGFILNIILPEDNVALSETAVAVQNIPFLVMFKEWLISTLKLSITITVIIYSLNIFQRLLSEFGVVAWISRFMRPLMLFFGLPAKTAFLWIIANIIGLGYGAAAMLDELARGKIENRDVRLLDTHICISHSNLEDLILLASLGALWWVMLLIRWAMSFVLVWEMRLEYYVKDVILRKKSTFAG